jgi:LmbE family N-acetylglucosaminyl deacetylase
MFGETEFTSILQDIVQKLSLKSSLSEFKKKSKIKIIILSPHPDDEIISGALALRLMNEYQAEVFNIAVTLGSNKQRQAARVKELTKACNYLKFENKILSDSWPKKSSELKAILKSYAPDLIIAPHLKDQHPTHIKTGELLKKVLPKLGKKFSCVIAWSEFWGMNSKANLLLEVPLNIVSAQMKALTYHVGEVERNPYHLRLPGWMMDNVRRGAELVKAPGAEAPRFAFGCLYQVQFFSEGKLKALKASSIPLVVPGHQ